MTRDAVSFSKLALDMFARRYIGMSIVEMQEHFKRGITSVTTLSGELEKAVNGKRLIVFIDDPDRCSLENVLEILDTLKLFLAIKNFIFIIAIDISWSYKVR